MMGFPLNFSSWIMRCVSTVSFSILTNGQPARRYFPFRELRQRDPLSPFLFILCAEGLSVLFCQAEEYKGFKGIPFGDGTLKVSHLIFADDSLIFLEASHAQTTILFYILWRYEFLSGQSINFQKWSIYFSRVVSTILSLEL